MMQQACRQCVEGTVNFNDYLGKGEASAKILSETTALLIFYTKTLGLYFFSRESGPKVAQVRKRPRNAQPYSIPQKYQELNAQMPRYAKTQVYMGMFWEFLGTCITFESICFSSAKQYNEGEGVKVMTLG